MRPASKHARAMMILDRLQRREQYLTRQAKKDLQEARRVAQLATDRATRANRERDDAQRRASEAIPIYVRARETERRYDQYAYVVSFSPRAFVHAILDCKHDQMLHIRDEVRDLAHHAADKIAATIMKEFQESHLPFGSPYGR